MKSEQVMLTLATLLVAAMLWLPAGCGRHYGPGADELVAPYESRRVWAVAPLRNESGSLHADGLRMADALVRHLESAGNLNVMPVNRVLAAMEALELDAIRSPAEAAAVRRTLGADAIVVGTITAYDPYDPPKLGIALELYGDPRHLAEDEALDVRRLSHARTDRDPGLPQVDDARRRRHSAADSVVSAVFDASSPQVRERIQRYASNRGAVLDANAWRRYRISMDLYMDFVGYVMSWRLLREESQRLVAAHPQPPAP